MKTEIFHLHQGRGPLLISIPHLGRELPSELGSVFTEEAEVLSDTDWHLDELYAFAREIGASILGANISRYVIDLNRPPGGESLYPGQTTTGLCPTETFRGIPLYRNGGAPPQEEIDRRRITYWEPYHAALKSELARIRGRHGKVLLWEAHSIASVLPRLFPGKLPDLNFGTNSGASCGLEIIDSALSALGDQDEAVRPTYVLNGRFKGGYITRRYGQPSQGVHAIQLEMCQSLYMDEESPFQYRLDLAQRVQPLLRAMLTRALDGLKAY
jgi:N-formylglutamate deformylase